MEIITRAEAIEQGLTRYFTGAPCKRGHIAPRRVANWNCETCVSVAKRRKSKDKKDAERQKREQETGRWITFQSEARAAGMSKYFPGTPCPAGHIGERYTRDGYCVQCAADKRAEKYKTDPAYRERIARWRTDNIEKARQGDAEYRKRNRAAIKERNQKYSASDKGRETKKKWQEENRERVNARTRERNAANPEAARHRRKKWKQKNPHVVAAHASVRRARLINATPRWADLEGIKRLYKIRNDIKARTGIEHHVDHIIPLQGKNVCGLHIPANLRIIPAEDNYRKNNKMPDNVLI